VGTGGKARPGRDADHSPPSSAEVKNEEELYLLSPQAPPWCVAYFMYELRMHAYIGVESTKLKNTKLPIKIVEFQALAAASMGCCAV
jgi:hypothetical protein